MIVKPPGGLGGSFFYFKIYKGVIINGSQKKEKSKQKKINNTRFLFFFKLLKDGPRGVFSRPSFHLVEVFCLVVFGST